MRKITEVIIHQSASSFGDADFLHRVAQQRFGVDHSYHYAILNGKRTKFVPYKESLDGVISPLQPHSKIGAHAAGHNLHSIGVCLIGEGDALPVKGSIPGADGYLTERQWLSLLHVCEVLRDQYGLKYWQFRGHRELPKVKKSCPGFDVKILREDLRWRWR